MRPEAQVRSCTSIRHLLQAQLAYLAARSAPLWPDFHQNACSVQTPHQRLTPRSRRGPTANRQARLQVRFIILPLGLALCRRSRLNSNVRPRQDIPWHFPFASALPAHFVQFGQPAATQRWVRRNTSACAYITAVCFGPSSIGAPSVRWCRPKHPASAAVALGGHSSFVREITQSVPAGPNPSLNRTCHGRPAWPGRRYAVHFRQPGQGVLPQHAG